MSLLLVLSDYLKPPEQVAQERQDEEEYLQLCRAEESSAPSKARVATVGKRKRDSQRGHAAAAARKRPRSPAGHVRGGMRGGRGQRQELPQKPAISDAEQERLDMEEYMRMNREAEQAGRGQRRQQGKRPPQVAAHRPAVVDLASRSASAAAKGGAASRRSVCTWDESDGGSASGSGSSTQRSKGGTASSSGWIKKKSDHSAPLRRPAVEGHTSTHPPAVSVLGCMRRRHSGVYYRLRKPHDAQLRSVGRVELDSARAFACVDR